jgi:hypothetical protein
MDRHFLEFWGNFLINAAKGQEQLEDMARWVGQGLRGFEDLTALFKKFYGLDSFDEENPDYPKIRKKAEKDFQESFQDYLDLFGFVTRQEHLALVKEYEALKEKVAAQEETIKHLQMVIEDKGIDQGEMVKGFQDLIRKQTDQFQKLMKDFGHSFEKDSPGERTP